MSFASDLVDAMLVHVATSLPGVTTRNAITEGYESDDQISLYPWCQGGIAPAFESEPIEAGQEDTVWPINFILLQEFDAGLSATQFIDALRVEIQNDPTLGGLATRAIVAEYLTSEIGEVAPTVTAFVITAQVIR